MSALALEIDQTLQTLDAATASHFERLVRDALALVRVQSAASKAATGSEVQFPLVRNARPISEGEYNGFAILPSQGRVVTSELVQHLMEESEAA